MKLDEAITIKRIWIDNGYGPPTPNEVEADNLSIEALKREQNNRKGTFSLLLPGETNE